MTHPDRTGPGSSGPPRRDVGAFDERASRYEAGWLGRLHHDIADRSADLVLRSGRAPDRLLDVGCGTGYLLRRLAESCPGAEDLAGIDPAPSMVEQARARAQDPRLRFLRGTVEHLAFPDASFDVVVSTTSFDHWQDQPAGLVECARVLSPGGRIVLVDQFSLLLLPTLIGDRRGKARTRRRASTLLVRAGFTELRWQRVYTLIIAAATATIPRR